MALDGLLKSIKSKLGDKNEDIILDYKRKLHTISTGSLLLDNILGGGLLVEKRITEVFGLESSGKTTICLQSVATALKQGKDVVFFDFEQTFDTNYAQALGVDIKSPNLAVFQPASLEEGLTILREMEKQVKDGVVIVIDSVAAAKPQELLSKAGEQQKIGLHAQRIGELCGYLQSEWCGKRKAYILLTNQVRRVPGSGSLYQAKAFKSAGVGFGTGDETFTTTGGQQLRFLASIRLSLDYAGKIEDGSYAEGNLQRTGNFTKAYVVKNKLCPPFQTAKLAIIFGEGTDDSFAIIDTLKEHGYISNAGASYTYLDSDKNEVGAGLSFKARGKDAFFAELKKPEYREDMKKTFTHLMATAEAVEIATADTEAEITELDFDTLDGE